MSAAVAGAQVDNIEKRKDCAAIITILGKFNDAKPGQFCEGQYVHMTCMVDYGVLPGDAHSYLWHTIGLIEDEEKPRPTNRYRLTTLGVQVWEELRRRRMEKGQTLASPPEEPTVDVHINQSAVDEQIALSKMTRASRTAKAKAKKAAVPAYLRPATKPKPSVKPKVKIATRPSAKPVAPAPGVMIRRGKSKP